MVRKEQVRMWVPWEFKQFVYEKKAQEPDKTLQIIMLEMTGKQRKKNNEFWL